jgi:hypothetical protein
VRDYPSLQRSIPKGWVKYNKNFSKWLTLQVALKTVAREPDPVIERKKQDWK